MTAQVPVLRVIDAAANRAGEGLRVVEDYTRFVLDDRHLTELIKAVRHDLTALLTPVGSGLRHAARESVADVGPSIMTSSEQQRGDLADVVTANFKRAEQALRSLEEFGKLLDANLAAGIEHLRYRIYTLERAVDITRTSADRMANCRLYILMDGRDSIADFQSMVEKLIVAGVHAIQLRDKTLNDRDLVQRARRLRELTRDTGTLCIVNDRPDIARLTDADGVHIGQEELSIKDARTIVGPSALIGVSTHSIEQARQAVIDGANYIGVGPTFPSQTKQFDSHPGLDLLSAVAAEIRLPAFAIGGIDIGNISQVLATGISRIAVSAAVVNATDPTAAAEKLKSTLQSKKT